IGRVDPLPGEAPKGAAWRRMIAMPPFILAFLALVVANSFLPVPAMLSNWALIGSKGLLLLAVTATAMRTRTDLILKLGWSSVLPVLAATITSFCVAFAFAYWVIR
ncbi:MAG TPA: putative sulfate exporter family transporter, partial [Novosphingobium sp.]|nr:putative sulfate exporter family transporter [Novosphingobium sp.]